MPPLSCPSIQRRFFIEFAKKIGPPVGGSIRKPLNREHCTAESALYLSSILAFQELDELNRVLGRDQAEQLLAISATDVRRFHQFLSCVRVQEFHSIIPSKHLIDTGIVRLAFTLKPIAGPACRLPCT